MPKQYKNNIERVQNYFKKKTIIVPHGKDGEKIVFKTMQDDSSSLNNMWFGGGGYRGYSMGSYYYNKFKYNRLFLFQDYDLMETDSIISRALDLLAEEACLPNEYDEIIQIDTDNEKIRVTLEHLFYEIMNVEFTLKGYIRQMLKYGDCFLFMVQEDKLGIVDFLPLSTVDVDIEYKDGQKEYKIASLNNKDIIFDDSNVVQFSNPKNIELAPYGMSHLESIRRYWKQLRLLEDFMMVYYLLRSVNQRVFRVDVGGLAPKDVPDFIQKIKMTFKKVPLQDEETGEYNLNYDPLTLIDDIVLPVREGYQNTEFDELPASTETNIVEGINYFRQKMMAGLGIPNFLLNYEEQINAKNTASSEDRRFGKTIESIQKLAISELEKIAVIHLILQGYTKSEVMEFSIKLTPPSDMREMEKIELLQQRVDLATAYKDAGFHSMQWVWENIFEMSEDEIALIKQQKLNEAIEEKLNESIIQQSEIKPEELNQDTQDDGSFQQPSDDLGPKGGLPEPTEPPDTTQSTAPEVEASDVIG